MMCQCNLFLLAQVWLLLSITSHYLQQSINELVWQCWINQHFFSLLPLVSATTEYEKQTIIQGFDCRRKTATCTTVKPTLELSCTGTGRYSNSGIEIGSEMKKTGSLKSYTSKISVWISIDNLPSLSLSQALCAPGLAQVSGQKSNCCSVTFTAAPTMSLNFLEHKPAQSSWPSVRPQLHADFYFKKSWLANRYCNCYNPRFFFHLQILVAW